MKKAIFGFGGHAKEVASYIHDSIFVVDDEYECKDAIGLSKISSKEYEIMVCVGDSLSRKSIVERLRDFKYFSFIHPYSVISKNAVVGDGSFIGPFCVINTDVKIGNHAILNRNVSVGHDTVVGDFLSMMPCSVLSGECKVDDCFYMGNNSSVRQQITIGKNVILGMNSGIIKDIQESGVYIGTPARKIK